MNLAALTPLAEIPSPTQSVWHIGSVPIRAYALCIVLGIVAACAVTEIRMRRRGAPPWVVLDIAVWAVPFGIVGARIYHVITSPDHYFGTGGNVVDAFKIWHGGLGIWGAVAGGAVGAWIAARRIGIPLSFVADALAPGLPLAQGIGRIGNWFNNELFGRQTTLPWGLKVYDWDTDNGRAVLDPDGNPIARPGLYQPTFLYEALWDFGVALLVWQLDKRYKFGRGRAFALYVMAYTVGRFWVENLRDDEAHHFLGMRINSWTSIVVFIGALIYFVRVRGPQTRLITTADGEIQVEPGDILPADGTPVPVSVGAPAEEATGTPGASGPSGGAGPGGTGSPGAGSGGAGSGGAGPGDTGPGDTGFADSDAAAGDRPDASADRPEPATPAGPAAPAVPAASTDRTDPTDSTDPTKPIAKPPASAPDASAARAEPAKPSEAGDPRTSGQ